MGDGFGAEKLEKIGSILRGKKKSKATAEPAVNEKSRVSKTSQEDPRNSDDKSMTVKRIQLSGDSEAILREHVVTIIESPDRGFQKHVNVDYEDLAKILKEAFQPSAVPEEVE